VKLTPELIYGFSAGVLSPRYDEGKPTPECHLEWWKYCCSTNPLVALAAPRGHAKSTAITHAYTLASVLFQDRKFVILVSDTYDQAVLFLQDIKSELLDNEQLIEMFGEVSLEKEAENDIICRMADGQAFRIIAKGSEQKVRGLKWDGMRPDLIVCDDLENDEIVLNKDRREKFRHWFFSALLPCRSDRGIVRIVGTILHMDSLLERLMPKPWDKKHTIIGELTLKSNKPRVGWLSVKYKAHSPDFKHILWPEKWSEQRLKAERGRYIDQGMPEKYAQEYLNEPIDDSNAFFRAEDFLPMGKEDLERELTVYMSVDFAISESERADFTVMVVGGVDDTGTLYILDVLRGRFDGMEIVDNLFALAAKYDPDLITVEAGAIEKALGPFIRAEMFKPGKIFLNLNTMVPTKDKQSRARSIQARMRAGGVRFNKETDWYPHLETEMRQFPRAANDDQVDAMAWLGLTLNKMIAARTPEEKDEEEYTMEYNRTMVPMGRSQIGGY